MPRLTAPVDRRNAPLLLAAGLAMAAVVGSALGFEHIGGYIPCALCLEQRTPYYIGAPLMFLAALSAWLKLPAILTRALALAGGLLMVYGAALGAYHSGVEWGWWPGPSGCSGVAGGATDAGSLLDDLNAITPPSCDEAALRIFGLSLAGWNVLASAALAWFSLRLAFGRRD